MKTAPTLLWRKMGRSGCLVSPWANGEFRPWRQLLRQKNAKRRNRATSGQAEDGRNCREKMLRNRMEIGQFVYCRNRFPGGEHVRQEVQKVLRMGAGRIAGVGPADHEQSAAECPPAKPWRPGPRCLRCARASTTPSSLQRQRQMPAGTTQARIAFACSSASWKIPP